MAEKMISHEEIKKQLAIVILAFADYESLELSLATHAKFSVDAGVPIFILQNGRGTYDNERTLSVAQRYQSLFPEHIKVITHIPPQKPYAALSRLFDDKLFSGYHYIIKLDDDVMVLTEDWIDKLIDCYIYGCESAGEDLAYVTSLVNNNPYGFKKLIDSCPELSSDYYANKARAHLIGFHPDYGMIPYRIVPKETVFGGGFGTIWQLPYLARWLHEKTTMQPEHYISLASAFGIEEVDSRERYSINCMLFHKTLWKAIDNGIPDDEGNLHEYCFFRNKKIFADFSIPMVHIAFYTQREEVRDMIPAIREVYERFLSLNFPIAICSNKMIEIENRLRFMEQMGRGQLSNGRKSPWLFRKIRGGILCYKEHGFRYTVHRTFEHLTGKAREEKQQ